MWKVLIRDSESGTGSLTVLVFDGGVGFTLEASASLDPTEAKDRAAIEDRNAGRAAVRRRVEERRDAIVS
jgi:hypothetical protein